MKKNFKVKECKTMEKNKNESTAERIGSLSKS
jgi:hypothetical protein